MRLAVALALAVAAANLPASAEDNWTLTENGAGPLRFGMTDEAVERAAGELPKTSPDELDGDCEYRRPARAPKPLGFMFNGNRLVRIDAYERGPKNEHGLAVGDAEAKVFDAYGRRNVKISAHPYIGNNGHYLSIKARRSDRHWIFETANGVITNMRIGFNGPVEFIEGCS